MTIEELEKRLRYVEEKLKNYDDYDDNEQRSIYVLKSIEEIKALHREYMYCVNNRQWDDVVNCFTEDASVLLPRHGLFKGKERISELYKVWVEKSNLGQGRDAHCVLQPIINVKGEYATGKWLMYIFISDHTSGNVLRIIQGRHDVEYVKTGGKWKISSLIFTRPWPEDSKT